MAKDQGVNMLQKAKGAARPSGPAKLSTASTAAPSPPKKRTSPAEFAKEVRAEARKITWTTWKETWITSVMVFIMVVVTSIFFLVVDGALGLLIQQVLKLAN